MELRQNTLLPVKGGLTGFQMKWIGIILMVVDHIHQMFYLQGVPDWFNWLGRPVAVIFMFLCAEGFYYTKNKKRYALQLLIGYWAMGLISTLLEAKMPLEDVALMNNIFGTLLVSVLYMALFDLWRPGAGTRVRTKILSVVAMVALAFVGALPLLMTDILPYQVIIVILRFVPCVIVVEGGALLVAMAVLFYYLRGSRLLQILVIAAISAISYFTMGGAQWLMVFAIIPILLYNGQKGRGSKYFFYIFYPAHIYLLYIIAFVVTV
ncbi:MAG: conjugal transfer protein TraX [Clostridiales Family XIII bacterium]|jgi:uncharacterized MnhB-related membrane protein|nr:conjugal transfer protein TraX [Clostridiales Family XIII bacterium]